MWGELEIRNHMISFLENNSDEITDSCMEYVRNIPIEINKRMKRSLGKYVFNPRTNDFRYEYSFS